MTRCGIKINHMEYNSIDIKTSVFLLTRFNLDLFSKDKNENPTRTEEWLSDRFSLFDKYCFPSVLNQSCKNFIWIVLFDDKTPNKYKEVIKRYQAKMNNFLPVYFSSKEAWSHQKLVNQVIDEHKDNSQNLITARVDNDDALHKDFMKNVFLLRNKCNDLHHFYSFGIGLQYYAEANLAIKLLYKKNHFLASVSRNYNKEKMINILQFPHPDIANYGIPFACIKNTEPMWVEVVHEHNVNNDCIMSLPQTPVYNLHLLERGFNWDVELDKKNITKQFFVFFLPRFCAQFFKKVGIKLLKR